MNYDARNHELKQKQNTNLDGDMHESKENLYLSQQNAACKSFTTPTI